MYVIPLVPLEDSKVVMEVEVEVLHYHYKIITDDQGNIAYE